MPDVVTVKMEGLKELAAALRTYSEDMQKKTARAAVGAGLAVMRNAAKNAVPVDTGALKRSIISWRSRKESGDGKETGKVGVKTKTTKQIKAATERAAKRGKKYTAPTPVYYWRFLEFGTSRMSPHPFFRPAFEAAKAQATAAMIERLRQTTIIKPSSL